MNTINFITGQGIKKIHRFPDGDIQVELKDLNRKHRAKIIMRLVTPEDRFLMEQVGDILRRQEVVIEEIYFPYLMCMRNDRVFNFNAAFNLKIICRAINELEPRLVRIFTPHNKESLLDNLEVPVKFDNILPYFGYCGVIEANGGKGLSKLLKSITTDKKVLVFPDKGAADNFKEDIGHKVLNPEIVCFEKERIIIQVAEKCSQQKIVLKQVNTNIDLKNRDVLVVDDLCDLGGTFVKLAEKLDELGVKSKAIIVSHMIQEGGVYNLLWNYNEVTFTNSFKDWDKYTDKELDILGMNLNYGFDKSNQNRLCRKPNIIQIF